MLFEHVEIRSCWPCRELDQLVCPPVQCEMPQYRAILPPRSASTQTNPPRLRELSKSTRSVRRGVLIWGRRPVLLNVPGPERGVCAYDPARGSEVAASRVRESDRGCVIPIIAFVEAVAHEGDEPLTQFSDKRRIKTCEGRARRSESRWVWRSPNGQGLGLHSGAFAGHCCINLGIVARDSRHRQLNWVVTGC